MTLKMQLCNKRMTKIERGHAELVRPDRTLLKGGLAELSCAVLETLLGGACMSSQQAVQRTAQAPVQRPSLPCA